ncbi:M67 family metallopeptidase [Erythrobacter sp. SD-21]|uniref:M67 family metallopeptidase n=1 Tax=Erythrobacter sp. SD-21 TaxID=161528 RepID=UPI0001540773|nr:M67 family metallopeptidase [Erythrobacter sp. SD-21]EDL47782.1 predicted metal-dependent protease [Erythrobacter sp. SD-21]
MTQEVSSQVLDALLAAAAGAHPRECCGILLGEGGAITSAIRTDNIHARPESHFEIDPQALVDAYRAARSGGPQVLGYYHSHPDGLARPSATDEAMATGQGLVWAIIAAGRVTFWREGDAGFTPLPYEVSPR